MSEPPPANEGTGETPAEKIRDVVAGWIDIVANQGERAIGAFGMRGPGKPRVPQVDIVESDDTVVVPVGLPGVDPTKAELVLGGNMLTVKGEPTSDGAQRAGPGHRR